MKESEAKQVANTPERKEIFVLKHFIPIKVEKAQTGSPSENTPSMRGRGMAG